MASPAKGDESPLNPGKTVLFAVDHSELSIQAIEVGKRFVRKSDKVVFLHIFSPDDPEKKDSRALEHKCELAFGDTPCQGSRFHLEEAKAGQVSSKILRIACECEAHLLVMSTKHKGQRVGRNSDPVIRQSACPVLVVRGKVPSNPDKYRTLVATNSSEVSFAGLMFVAKHSREGDEVEPLVFGTKEGSKQLMEKITSLPESGQGQVEKPRLVTRYSGNIGQDLCFSCDEEGSGMLVVATGRKTSAELGSVSSYCIYHAPCPVLVYKHPSMQE